ncbi:hypothetical protein BH10CYA1_BH10CYA1_12940 [soil metagenome]
MKLNLTLPQKGLLLVLVPLVVQLGVLSYLTYLQSQQEQLALRAARAGAVDGTINHLVKDFLDHSTRLEWESGNNNLDPEYWTSKAEITDTMSRLKEMIKDEPEKLATIEEVERTAVVCMKLLEEHKAANGADFDQPVLKEKRHQFKAAKTRISELVSQQLIPLCTEEKRILSISPELQSANRSRVRLILIITVLIDILFAITVAVFYNRGIVTRLATIFDNNLRLASGVPLHPRATGSDEIVKLDNMFHNMADALQVAAQKERLVVENARDLICSFDGKGTFITVSPASTVLVGYSPEELIGSKISRLIFSADKEVTQDNLKLMINGEQIAPFETRLIRQDGIVIDALWSARWSQSEGTLFCVLHDNTERKRAERLRQEVVQMVSHDLRTPLTSIRGILEMIESGSLGELTERGKQLVGMADQSSVRMLSLIRDLLEIEKMEAGMLELHKQQVSISSIIEQSLATVQPIARERKVNLVGEPNSSLVFADGDRMIQVLVNLLSNAVKFSPPNSTVKVCVTGTPENTEFSVIDQGRGIPPQSLSMIFERFRQVQESDSTKEGGSGLGLAICKALVELHGGDISATSVVGKGSTFSFRIPS